MESRTPKRLVIFFNLAVAVLLSAFEDDDKQEEGITAEDDEKLYPQKLRAGPAHRSRVESLAMFVLTPS